MIVENPEALKTWLTKVLEPLCDADPAALAKYVYALVKKDKPLPQLKESMVEQLEVFLQSETKRFVSLLFVVLEKQDYTHPVPAAISQLATGETPSSTTEVEIKVETPRVPTPEPPTKVVEPTPQSTNQPTVSSSTTNNANTASVTPSSSSGATVASSVVQVNGSAVNSAPSSYVVRTSHRKSDSDRDDKTRGGRSRHISPPRNRSRSRSWERSRRSRSRDRLRERDRSRWRNKSPPPRRYDRDRRRSWSRTRGGSRSRTRSRSPRHGSGFRSRYRRSPVGRVSLSRSRSHSIDRKKEPLSGAATPTQDSNHGDSDTRLNTTSQSIQSVVSQVPKRRCRDFDEKGYCMRGDLCPFDHGSDPVVLEDVSLSQVLPYDGDAAQSNVGPPVAGVPNDMGGHPSAIAVAPSGPGVMGGAQPPPSMVQMAAHMPPFHHTRFPPPPPVPAAMEYNPDAPSMEPRMSWSRMPPRGGAGIRGRMVRGPIPPPNIYNPMQQQRELVSVPLNDHHGGPLGGPHSGYKRPLPQDNNQNYPMHGDTLSLSGHSPMKRRPGFDYGRLGPLGPRGKHQGNCSLELKKVPCGVNNITHLNNHFAKFGNIVNIQVQFGGDPEAALVTFSSHAEANAAYRSTEAVLNNRFIKVLWYNNNNNNNGAAVNEGKQENVPPLKQSVKDRLGAPVPMQVKVLNSKVAPQLSEEEVEEQVLMSGNSLTKTLYIKKDVSPAPAPTPVLASVLGSHHVNKAQAVAQAQAQQAAAAAVAAANMKKMQEVAAAKQNIRKKQEEKRREALQLTADLRKRKQELLEKQLEQQKQLIQKLEKPDVTKEQRQELLSTIKSLQLNVEKIRKDLAVGVVNTTTNSAKVVPAKVVKSPSITKTSPPNLVKKTKEEAQREILDAELDLIAKQQEGGDTAELLRKVAILKMEAANQAIVQAPVVKAVRGSLRTVRGRGVPRLLAARNPALYRTGNRRGGFAGHSVDHRPSKILVSGYEEDDEVEVLAHFAQYGVIVDHVSDDTIPSLILNYKSRKEAELAMTKGRNFQDRLLSITWHAGVPRPGRGAHPHIRSTVHHNSLQRQVMMVGDPGVDLIDDVEGHDEDEEELVGLELEPSEEALLLDDEEEEEESEDRSWRR